MWNSTLLLIPANIDRHWILLVVCNAREAVSSRTPRVVCQQIEPSDNKPDGMPFCILSMDSFGASRESLRGLLRSYLQFDYQRRNGEPLEYLDGFRVRVSFYVNVSAPKFTSLQCPFQMDAVSCGLHTIRHVEVMLSNGTMTSTLLRKHAQVSCDSSLLLYLPEPANNWTRCKGVRRKRASTDSVSQAFDRVARTMLVYREAKRQVVAQEVYNWARLNGKST